MYFAYSVPKDSPEGAIISEFTPYLAWDTAVIHVYANFSVDNNCRDTSVALLDTIELRSIQLFFASEHCHDIPMEFSGPDLNMLLERAEIEAWNQRDREME